MKPTDSELEILQILWEHGPMTVRELNDIHNRTRKVGYTTSLKMMQIMIDKGMLSRDTALRSHVYSADLRQEDVQTHILDHVLKTVFMGDRSKLVLQALGSHQVSARELAELKALTKKWRNNKMGLADSQVTWLLALG